MVANIDDDFFIDISNVDDNNNFLTGIFNDDFEDFGDIFGADVDEDFLGDVFNDVDNLLMYSITSSLLMDTPLLSLCLIVNSMMFSRTFLATSV